MADRRVRGRPVLTGRALVLGAVLVLLVVVLAAPITRYLGSRGDVGHAASQLHQDRSELRALTRQQQRLDDPGYIQQQARDRLQYAMPGDTVYVVVDKGAKSDLAASSGHGTSKPARGRTWNNRIWASVRSAGG
ncbi:septum formation initiator family protein [uncultured Jatrophihabitans sp.]|uniref:FtsB family cell division protein n=1 Tax=uncultured Jatrophihabitans sp. TaxID=1610747 RepID=UPI0035CB991B